MKKAVFILSMLLCGIAVAKAQFPIKIPKVKVPKVEATPSTQNRNTSDAESGNNSRQSSNRQMLMDDGFTFFDAEPVKEYDSKISLEKDIGWYLKSSLRIIGTVPKRSAFKVSVKKNGKELSAIRCEGMVYTKTDDPNLRTPQLRAGKDLNYEDFMTAGGRCFDEKAVIKEIGEMDVEIYFIDGESNAEKLVRKHKIDVRKATKVRGNASAPQPDVADYYIQRHAEAAVAIAYFSMGRNATYFGTPFDTYSTPTFRTLNIHTTFSPAEQTRLPVNPFVQCSVNGQKISLQNDKARVTEGPRREIGIYTDRIGAKHKTGPPYKDWVEFIDLNFQMPLFTSEGQYAKPTMKVENFQGKWECAIIENGVTFRTFRWEVGKNGILPHAEQKSGNINLFYDAALVEMEIPTGGSPIDFRLLPLPNAGLFYGISWTSSEGKAMAGRVPKLGNPYHVPSK
jgi:hypothetical protein